MRTIPRRAAGQRAGGRPSPRPALPTPKPLCDAGGIYSAAWHLTSISCRRQRAGRQRAAVQAAKLGKRAAIIEQQAGIGGVCLESGTIPSKTFAKPSSPS